MEKTNIVKVRDAIETAIRRFEMLHNNRNTESIRPDVGAKELKEIIKIIDWNPPRQENESVKETKAFYRGYEKGIEAIHKELSDLRVGLADALEIKYDSVVPSDKTLIRSAVKTHQQSSDRAETILSELIGAINDECGVREHVGLDTQELQSGNAYKSACELLGYKPELTPIKLPIHQSEDLKTVLSILEDVRLFFNGASGFSSRDVRNGVDRAMHILQRMNKKGV